MGLISEAERDELIVISEVRNRFAHEFGPVAFTDAEAAALIGKLKTLPPPPPHIRNWTTRKSFIANAGTLCMVFSGKLRNA